MKAAVVEQPGGPEVLTIKKIPTPKVKPGWVLIKVKAFGLNRAEMFTRQGHSPDVKFPRVLGIEAVGEIVDASDTRFDEGQQVAAVMGNMGRHFNGSYAEYVLMPQAHVIPFYSTLDWISLAAIPESFLTAWGALFQSLEVIGGQTLLIRGGTSALGLVSLAIAKDERMTVISTSRRADRLDFLREQGADLALVDDGNLAVKIREHFPQGVDRVLELVGTTTLRDSLKATAHRGIVSMTGLLGNSWELENFAPMSDIPSTVHLTWYSSHDLTSAIATPALAHILRQVEAGIYPVTVSQVFALDEIVEAHRYMESNQAQGKIVVAVDV